MKKFILIFIVILTAFLLAGCADPYGLHNQKQTLVVFEFVNFPLADGDYCVSGSWQGTTWDNSRVNIAIKGGKGSSTEQAIKSSYVKFTIVPARLWSRPWFPATMGNAPDESQGNTLWNFEVHGIPMDSNITITIDGGKKPADVTWK